MAIVSAADVAAWADIDLSVADTTVMDGVIAAVEAALALGYDVPEPVPADIVQAVLMQSARLYQRRYTVHGIAQFGDAYATRVSRFDPDIDSLLDPYRKWVGA